MSGFLPPQVIALFTGGFVVLGDFVFTDMELPETLSWGGRREMIVHRLPGGQRVIDDMGDDPAQIAWSGRFFEPFARFRRAMLDQIKSDGQPVLLAFKDQVFTVVVSDLTFREISRYVEYSIACTVLPDPVPGDDDPLDLGDGAPPDTPAVAQQQGQAATATARSVAPSLPVPPIPPQPSGVGQG